MIVNDISLIKSSNWLCHKTATAPHLPSEGYWGSGRLSVRWFNGFKLFEQASCKHLGQAIAFYCSKLWLKSTQQNNSKSFIKVRKKVRLWVLWGKGSFMELLPFFVTKTDGETERQWERANDPDIYPGKTD